MNINAMLNKSLLVLASKGQLYKYNTYKFYSEDNCRYSTKHQLLKRIKRTTKKGNEIYHWEEVKTSYSNREILEYLMGDLRRMD